MSKRLLGNQREIGFTGVVVVALAMWALICMAFAENTLADATDGALARIGFSRAVLGDVNENDAVAAMRIWGQVLVEETNIDIDPIPKDFEDSAEIKNALILGTLEFVSVTAAEYYALQHLMENDYMIVGVVDGSIYEEYVVLVNRQKDFAKLADLQGRDLRWGGSARNSLALIWLDTVLAGKGFDTSIEFFKTISHMIKTSDIVLPVFFGKVDACIVTRSAFELMVELNPQIGKQMRVLATSPPLIPALAGFRTGFVSPVKFQVINALTDWHRSSRGRQILTLFQIERLEKQPISYLGDTLTLVKEHQNFFGTIESISTFSELPVVD